MKKIGLLLFGLVMSCMTFAQDYTPATPVKTGFMHGRTIYIGGGWDCALPPSSLGYSIEGGIWGTDKNTSIGIDVDFMKSIPSNKKTDTFTLKTTWFGPKGYLTMWHNSSSQYYVYLSPKIDANLTHTLLEVGFNPCYEINRHTLASISLCDQIWNDQSVKGNNFNQSIWHPGISIGLIIFK